MKTNLIYLSNSSIVHCCNNHFNLWAHSFVSQSTIYFQIIPSIRRTFGHLGNRTKRTISLSKLVLRCAYRGLGLGLYFCWHFWPAGLYFRWGLSIVSPVNCLRRAKRMRLKPKTFSMRQRQRRRRRRQTKQRALKAHKHVFVFAVETHTNADSLTQACD